MKKKLLYNLAHSKVFESAVIILIIANCIFIGIETYIYIPFFKIVETLVLIFFTLEIIIRWLIRENTKEFFTSGWNIFDMLIVGIGYLNYLPEFLFVNSENFTIFRILRVFRILRLLRTSKELKIIITVLFRSFRTLFYNACFFLIFLYLFALLGHSLFKLPSLESLENAQLQQELKAYYEVSSSSSTGIPDPYNSLHESMFTLFRILTGEDWTDFRYNLLYAVKIGIIKLPSWIVTAYHVLWYSLSVFLLLNLLVGAVLNNYQTIMEENKNKKDPKI